MSALDQIFLGVIAVVMLSTFLLGAVDEKFLLIPAGIVVLTVLILVIVEVVL